MSSFFDDIEDDILNDDVSDNIDDTFFNRLKDYHTFDNIPYVPLNHITYKHFTGTIIGKNIAFVSEKTNKITASIYERQLDTIRQLIRDNNRTLMLMSDNKRNNLTHCIYSKDYDYLSKIEYQPGTNIFTADLSGIDVIIDLHRYLLESDIKYRTV